MTAHNVKEGILRGAAANFDREQPTVVKQQYRQKLAAKMDACRDVVGRAAEECGAGPKGAGVWWSQG